MLRELDQFWTISDNRLYRRDEYVQKHSVDVREFYMIAFKVSCIATMLVFLIGVLVCLL